MFGLYPNGKIGLAANNDLNIFFTINVLKHKCKPHLREVRVMLSNPKLTVLLY